MKVRMIAMSLVVALCATPGSTVAAGNPIAPPVLVDEIGPAGYGALGVAVDSAGGVLVAETDESHVAVFDRSGRLVRRVGASGKGSLLKPAGVDAGLHDEIVVADHTADRVTVFRRNGTFKFRFGRTGDGNGEFRGPQDVAVDSKGRILVADAFNYRIQIFDDRGNFIKDFSAGFAIGVAVDSKDRIIVTSNSSSPYVGVYDKNGTFLFKFKIPGKSTAVQVRGVDVDARDRIYVVDFLWPRHDVLVYDRNGNLLIRFGAQRFSIPADVAVAPNGRIVTTDESVNKVSVWRYLTCGGRQATRVGTAGDNTITGTSIRDVIVARGGDDVVRAGGGDDLVCLGGGNDKALGGSGNDRLYGNPGRDTLRGGPGPDTCHGGPGIDKAFGCAKKISIP